MSTTGPMDRRGSIQWGGGGSLLELPPLHESANFKTKERPPADYTQILPPPHPTWLDDVHDGPVSFEHSIVDDLLVLSEPAVDRE